MPSRRHPAAPLPLVAAAASWSLHEMRVVPSSVLLQSHHLPFEMILCRWLLWRNTFKSKYFQIIVNQDVGSSWKPAKSSPRNSLVQKYHPLRGRGSIDGQGPALSPSGLGLRVGAVCLAAPSHPHFIHSSEQEQPSFREARHQQRQTGSGCTQPQLQQTAQTRGATPAVNFTSSSLQQPGISSCV
ncbi:hypothetical protein NDU88_003231 [Pleurodeles waltl]|uniref:Uncharacterized protein n=1 Tax=Pleurodeles waltl TaxID=8319 RepID=A0AAV7QC46_PLEWA|nr:hypothetical protein NDU88_003231 [Pleurodeles waltl]